MSFLSPQSLSNAKNTILGLGVVVFIDQTISEDHFLGVEYTRYATELGYLPSDNSVIQPKELNMQVYISDTPQGDIPIADIAFEGRHKIINAQLEIACLRRIPLIVTTSLKTYINVYLSEIRPSKNQDSGRGIEMSLKFVELPQNGITDLALLAASALVDSTIAHSAVKSVSLGII